MALLITLAKPNSGGGAIPAILVPKVQAQSVQAPDYTNSTTQVVKSAFRSRAAAARRFGGIVFLGLALVPGSTNGAGAVTVPVQTVASTGTVPPLARLSGALTVKRRQLARRRGRVVQLRANVLNINGAGAVALPMLTETATAMSSAKVVSPIVLVRGKALAVARVRSRGGVVLIGLAPTSSVAQGPPLRSPIRLVAHRVRRRRGHVKLLKSPYFLTPINGVGGVALPILTESGAGVVGTVVPRPKVITLVRTRALVAARHRNPGGVSLLGIAAAQAGSNGTASIALPMLTETAQGVVNAQPRYRPILLVLPRVRHPLPQQGGHVLQMFTLLTSSGANGVANVALPMLTEGASGVVQGKEWTNKIVQLHRRAKPRRGKLALRHAPIAAATGVGAAAIALPMLTESAAGVVQGREWTNKIVQIKRHVRPAKHRVRYVRGVAIAVGANGVANIALPMLTESAAGSVQGREWTNKIVQAKRHIHLHRGRVRLFRALFRQSTASGVGAVALPIETVASTGTVAVSGSSAVALPMLTDAATATVAISATGAVVIPMQTVIASSGITVIGTGTAHVPMLTVSAAGAVNANFQTVHGPTVVLLGAGLATRVVLGAGLATQVTLSEETGL